MNIYERPDHDLLKTVRMIPHGETLIIGWSEVILWNKKPTVFAISKRGHVTAYIRVGQINFPIFRA